MINEGRDAIRVTVTNLGDRPIQVGSHYHFAETNRALDVRSRRGQGRRLDIPAGTAVRFEPGESKTVALVEIAGNRVVRGGDLSTEDAHELPDAASALHRHLWADHRRSRAPRRHRSDRRGRARSHVLRRRVQVRRRQGAARRHGTGVGRRRGSRAGSRHHQRAGHRLDGHLQSRRRREARAHRRHRQGRQSRRHGRRVRRA